MVTPGNIAYLYVMKHLTALLAAVITFAASAQQMPYNPDVNADAIIGVDDVLGVLGLYDTALMQPDLQCDYELTEFEAFISGVLNQTLVLDSVYVEYEITDTTIVYTVECPDPLEVPTTLVRSYMFVDWNENFGGDSPSTYSNVTHLNMTRQFSIQFDGNQGIFFIYLSDNEIASFTNYFPQNHVQTNISGPQSTGLTLPFPDDMTLDENGFNVPWMTEYYGIETWIPNCSHFRLIPFWHEAE